MQMNHSNAAKSYKPGSARRGGVWDWRSGGRTIGFDGGLRGVGFVLVLTWRVISNNAHTYTYVHVRSRILERLSVHVLTYDILVTLFDSYICDHIAQLK